MSEILGFTFQKFITNSFLDLKNQNIYHIIESTILGISKIGLKEII